ncbi:MAG: Tricarboxylate transport protein TctC [uncultured Acetobacteraceae bacterium]|uniref:Tricarboxylate transport protein TctC n=1 Tax=uncultured Acetobacteraceae bacterium TaxID=169975 RepID=A0A6J4HYS3_9PROT|nr:MAG: Tricarboxylate transport protein TctC [uncultured Acetobacteraceae bacterium]
METLRRSEFIALASSAAASLGLGAGAARAADYPTRPVELAVPSSAGGGTDAVARAFAEAAKRHSPQPLVVLNRPGASGAIGVGEVLNAAGRLQGGRGGRGTRHPAAPEPGPLLGR